ncbi:MAG: DUF1573 domain-containing protein [Thermoguttaceae bacterium]
MDRGTFRATSLAVVLVLTTIVVPCFGQRWAEDMLDHRSHDFGMVARGAKIEHRFTLENIYEEDARIVSARSSCGCTTPKFSTKILKTWDKTEIVAVLDTRNFLGQKDSTITIRLDLPFPAEVQLHVHAYIRRNVVIQPEAVAFGTVTQGTAARQTVKVSYAGRDDWAIERVTTDNPSLKARVVKTRSGGGFVDYDLIVDLAEDAPVGYIREHLILVTNDAQPRASRVPVTVEGVVIASAVSPGAATEDSVVPTITVRPSTLLLGVIGPGESATRPLVVQGSKPFKVVSATCEDERFACATSEKSSVRHLLPVTFTADEQTGTIHGKILIKTDPAAKPVEAAVQVRVMPEEKATAAE